MLNGNAARSSQARYALEVLLSTVGVPYEFAPDLDEAVGRGSARRAFLVVGQEDTQQIGHLARLTAVVVLPSPNVGETGRRGDGESHHSSLDPRQFTVLEEPTGGGYILRISGDLVGATFAVLARAEEYTTAARDQHDRFQWANSELDPPELAVRPLVSEYAQLLLASLKEACAQARLPMVRKEFWPLGRPMAGCLTHDVDVVRRGKLPRGVAIRDVRGILSSAARREWGVATTRAATIARTVASAQDPYWSFDRISSLETKHDYRSTYYFMAGHHHPEDASYDLDKPPMTQLMRALAESGCEIGLHGSYASYADTPLLRSQKDDLEKRTGHAVVGHRNHLLRFRVPGSWRAQEMAGFSYDATLGFHDREGLRGGHAFPFHPYDLAAGRSFDLMEIPLAIMDVGLMKYRKLRGEKMLRATLSTLEQIRKVNGLATLLWHNHTFYDPEYPDSGRAYATALDWLAEQNAHVATGKEIDGWWRARAAVRLSPLREGRTGWRMDCPREIKGLVLRINLPDPQASLRVRGQVPLAVKRDGAEYLLEFGTLPAGFTMELEYA